MSNSDNVLREKRDFFVSFNRADRAWATWIAWVLEEAGYAVWFQDWDFRGNFVEHMQRAHREAYRTVAVLSSHYFGSDFTLAEWSARFAQDPAAREDRLVPVKIEPFTDEGILNPIIYADLSDCDETEAQQRLLGRVRKAVDASYRAKPADRPGFPNAAAPRIVPEKPSFPPAQVERAPQEGHPEETAMPGSRSIKVGRNAVGNVIIAGDSNRTDARIEVRLVKTELPPPGSINITRELARIRAILEPVSGEKFGRIGRALDDAAEEASRLGPDRNEIGAALGRALDYAKKGSGFADEMHKLAPHVRNAVAWLGGNWHKLLAGVGLSV